MHEVVVDTPIGRISGLRLVPRPVRRGRNEALPRVLALHGWLDNAASFVPLAAQLGGIELVAIDLPGHGASAHLPAGADYSFASTVNTLLDVVDALQWNTFCVLGHSMGAGIGSLLAAACPDRVERFVAIEALGALPETPERTVARLRNAVAAARGLPGKRLRVFPDLDSAVRARMQANALSEPVARLLVERGTVAVEGGYVWSSDPRLTLPAMMRLTEAQIENLVAGITCPTRVLYADPAQSYFPEPLRSERVRLLPQGELRVVAGSHHLHMEDPQAVAAAIGDFFVR